MNMSSWIPPRSTTIFSCKNVCPTTFKSLLPAVTPNFHSISTSWLTMNVWPTTDLERAIRFDFHLSETWGELSAERPFKYKNKKMLGWLECSFTAARVCSHVQSLEPEHGLKKFNQGSRSCLSLNFTLFLWKGFHIIDLVTVFDAILTSRQTCEKIQYLYENLLSNNFGKTAVLKKILIVN